MTRKTAIQSLTVVGEYVPALMRGSQESLHASMSARVTLSTKISPSPRMPASTVPSSSLRPKMCRSANIHFSSVVDEQICRFSTFSRSKEAAYVAKRSGSFVVGRLAPWRIESSSVFNQRRASSGSVRSGRFRTTCRIDPVFGSMARPRTRNPPSFLLYTPGRTGLGSTQLFHFRTHCCFFIFASVGLRRRSRTSGTQGSRHLTTQVPIERLAAPHEGAAATATADRCDAAVALRLAERAGGLEAAVHGGFARGEEGARGYVVARLRGRDLGHVPLRLRATPPRARLGRRREPSHATRDATSDPP